MKTNNELIAEFMGYSQPHPDYPNTTYWHKEGEAPLTILSFDTDWNWLMRVVKKIFYISLNLDAMEKYYNVADSIPCIKNTYISVIDFIKWYNEQNN